MKTLSLKLDDLVYKETEEVIGKIKIARNRYINEALAHYNRFQKRKIIAEKLKVESSLIGEDSMTILSEFEKFEEYDA